MHKLPFGNSSIKSTFPLQYIYSDVWGPAPVDSVNGFKYYLIFVDNYTKYVWLYPLKAKSEVSTVFPRFKALVEKLFRRNIVSFYSDNGGEFIHLSNYFSENGISHFRTPPHTPEHNGMAERRHRHIVETGLTLLHMAKLPLSFWSYAFCCLPHKSPSHARSKS
jgi:transposase InsO family protein